MAAWGGEPTFAEALVNGAGLREHHNRYPVPRPQMSQCLPRCLGDLFNLSLHAAADVEQQNQIQRLVTMGECNDRLRLPLVCHREIAFGQAIDQILALQRQDVHSHIGHPGLEGRRFSILRPQRR